LSENKCSLLFRSLIENLDDLTKDNIADDLEYSSMAISGAIKGFIILYQNSVHIRAVHGNGNNWIPWVPWDFHGNGGDNDYIMRMKMGVKIKIWEWE